ncbi:2-dehydro-3-deoxy-6-phosphogalactonate aldolase [Parasedimentitalea marina]|uniref:2-dehydro-3-deoxy-6-phosphogalactonate aldolase n=1 Tax=Parasedimentitalea marina TaxID=2483033 RepID=A0A3T0N028_9RHOB|nr:2-dehydro-3-deoxy-6-phosphogalactonate aldolase [Parasedimentitalea marina]AZV77349.1 2-dehydro-3-deoxy-6-phosphogalactonate aldolase [Parasedimentitalea marina]
MTREIIAILRGIQSHEICDIADVLIAAGITKIEVPLNSPDPFATIALLVKHAGDRAVVGAGTVLETDAVTRLADIGAQMVVSPDTCAEVIRATKAAEMLSYPGVMTPSECFAALRAGADGIKLFPAFKIGVDGFAAVKSVLPVAAKTYAVGGVGPDNFADWQAAGITGFGIGTGIYKVGFSAADVAKRADEIVIAYDKVFP